MNFQGFEVTPVGNASVAVTANGQRGLKVSNIGDSGLDGILINTEGHDNYKVHFNEFSNLVNTRGVVKRTTLMKNGFDQVITTGEQFEWYDPNVDKVLVGFSTRLLPRRFNFVGYLEGREVFNFEEDSENPIPPVDNIVGWISLGIAAAALAVSIYNTLKATKTTTTVRNYDANGNFTGSSISESIDPVPFEIMVRGRPFIVDEFGIKYDRMLVPPLPPNPEAFALRNAGLIVTASRIREFTITSIGEPTPTSGGSN